MLLEVIASPPVEGDEITVVCAKDSDGRRGRDLRPCQVAIFERAVAIEATIATAVDRHRLRPVGLAGLRAPGSELEHATCGDGERGFITGFELVYSRTRGDGRGDANGDVDLLVLRVDHREDRR